MRGLALVVVAAAVLAAHPARAQAPSLLRERGPVSVAGVSFLGLGLGAAGLGLAGLLGSLDASALLQSYLGSGGAPSQADAPAAAALAARASEQRTLAIVGFAGAGALLAAGVVCLAVDAPRASPVALGLVPLPGGGWVSAAWRW